MLTVFLTDRHIQTVEGEQSGGRIHIRSVLDQALPDGLIRNSRIADRDNLLQELKSFWEEKQLPIRDVALILDSPAFTVRAMEVPNGGNGAVFSYIRREFGNIDRIEDPIFGYFPLIGQTGENAKTTAVYAVMAERAYIRDYAEIFHILGIELRSIENARGSLLRLSGSLNIPKDRAYIVQYVDNATLINMLMLDGKHYYSNRHTLSAEQGSIGYSIEIARAASRLLQFAKSQNMSAPVTDVYSAGLTGDDFSVYADSIQRIDDTLTVSKVEIPLDADSGIDVKALDGYSVSIGGLLTIPVKTGLLKQIKKKQGHELKFRSALRRAIPAIIVGVIMVGICTGVEIHKSRLQAQLDEMNAYNEQVNIQKDAEAYDNTYTTLKSLNGLYAGMTSLETMTGTYPTADGSAEQIIENAAGDTVAVEMRTYSADSGELTFACSADTADAISAFIHALEENEAFDSVDYNGYQQNAEGGYQVTVCCVLAGEEAAE